MICLSRLGLGSRSRELAWRATRGRAPFADGNGVARGLVADGDAARGGVEVAGRAHPVLGGAAGESTISGRKNVHKRDGWQQPAAAAYISTGGGAPLSAPKPSQAITHEKTKEDQSFP